MTRLTWDSRRYDFGVDRGVFYPQNSSGETWNGLTSVIEAPPAQNKLDRYIDGVKTSYQGHLEYFSGTIEAFTYPESFYEDVLAQKRSQGFGLSYRVESDNGYKIHLVYNVLVSPSSMNYQQNVVDHFSWAFTTMPVGISGMAKSSHVIIDCSVANAATVAALEDVLYGSVESMARLPLPDELSEIFEEHAVLRVTDHGDGTFTVTGPDSAITMLDSTTFQIAWPSAVYIDAVSYTISSL